MSDEKKLRFEKEPWTHDYIEDYSKAKTDDERREMLLVFGCDEAHVRDAARLFPEQLDDLREWFPEYFSSIAKAGNIIIMAGRDGSYVEHKLTDEQLAALKLMLDQLPEADDL